jgi:trans-2,3-dihydro-3-hydroxyanthranilate isomerase
VPKVDYLLYDVFTDTPFTGNPLAVAIDPPALTTDQCATVARELNLSETVFLRTGSDEVETRIFTPAAELPFAGHPTVGAAIALHDEGLVGDRVVLAEPVGPVTVDIDTGNTDSGDTDSGDTDSGGMDSGGMDSGDFERRLATLTTTQPPVAMEVADPEDVARSLGLGLADLEPNLGPRGWSAGNPFTVVAVRDVDVLGRCQVDLGPWRETVARTASPELFVLAPLDGLSGRRWRARMFAPALGILEDPATGSAAAAAVGFLAAVATPDRLEEGWIITQGVEMGRPSELHVGAVLRGGELVASTVGGRAVRVGRGEMHL